jgi:hypothetical protein
MSPRVPVSGLLTFLFLCLAVPSTTIAQETVPRRQGVWFLIGAGYGSASIDCDQCDADHEPGFSGILAFGGTVSERLLVGIESDWWTREDQDVWTSVGNISAVGYLFPRRDLGLFLKAGVGAAGFHATGFGPDPDHVGFGVIGGVGYEIPINWQISIVPTAGYHWGTLGDAGASTGVTEDLWQFSISVYSP